MLYDGKTVSRNGVIEFVEPLVCVNPRLRNNLVKLNEDVAELNLKTNVLVKVKMRLVLNAERGYLLALRSVYMELTTMISSWPLK